MTREHAHRSHEHGDKKSDQHDDAVRQGPGGATHLDSDQDRKVRQAALNWKARIESGKVSLDDIENGNVEAWFFQTAKAMTGGKEGQALDIFIEVLVPAINKLTEGLEKQVYDMAMGWVERITSGDVSQEQVPEVEDWFWANANRISGVDHWSKAEAIFDELLRGVTHPTGAPEPPPYEWMNEKQGKGQEKGQEKDKKGKHKHGHSKSH